MDGLNKIISFILGLVVVIVFFAVVTGKISFKKGVPIFSATATLSGTPTPTPASGSAGKVTSIKISESPTSSNKIVFTNNTSTTKSIPSTGLPLFFIPSLLASAGAGAFLRKTGKKS